MEGAWNPGKSVSPESPYFLILLPPIPSSSASLRLCGYSLDDYFLKTVYGVKMRIPSLFW